jgi:hypothetical protein
MANTSRSYAEQLVGPLNKSHYDTQRKVANQSYETNWEDLQNQYKNLQEQLKQRQEQANRDYASGLVQVAENSFDRMNSVNNNMVNRGLTTSGLNNLMTQADTTAKGEEVSKLLDNSGNIAVQIANQLKSGNETYADKATNLADNLSDTLGNIGANELNAQMEYNAGLANLAEAKDARDMENALAAKQRAASASSSSGGKSDVDEELEEFYKRQAINEILIDTDMSDIQKRNSLAILFEKGNADDILKAYSKNVKATDTYNKKTKEIEKKIKNEKNKPSPTPSREILTYDSKNNKKFDNLYNDIYVNKNNTIYGPTIEDYNSELAKLTRELSKHKNSGITYEELANLLYGSK